MKVKASQAAEERPSSPVEDCAAASSFAEVARVITGDDNRPLWLVKHFERWAPSLAMSRHRRHSAEKSKNEEEPASRQGCGTHAD